MSADLVKLGIGVVAAAGVIAGGLYLSRKFRNKVREDVKEWLHQNNLNETALMDVLMVCDQVGGYADKLTCKIFVETKEKGRQVVSEETYSMDEFKKMNPDVAAKLDKKQRVQSSLLKLVT